MKKVPSEALRRQVVALIPVFLNVFMMGCNGGWLPNAIYFFMLGDEVTATAAECSLIASCTEIGRMIFALPGGLLADKFGRKKIIICAGLAHLLSCLVQSAYTSVTVLCVARFTFGIATALVNATSLVSIGEIASPEVRGKVTSIYQVFMCGGVITPGVITALFSSYYVLSYVITVLSLLCFVSMYWTIETPNYLVNMSKHDQARNTLQRIRLGYSEDDINYEFDKLKNYIDDENKRKKELSWTTFFTSKSIAKPLATCLLLNFFSMSTGSSVNTAYITTLYPQNEYFSKRFYPLIVYTVQLVISISTAFYIERFSRRSIFMSGAAIMSISQTVCAATNFYYTEFHVDAFKWVFAGVNLFQTLTYCGSVQPMNSALKSELLPQTVKGVGGALGVIGQAVATVISYQLYNYMTENVGLYMLYVVFSVNSLILCSLVFFLLPEGRGRFLADVQMEFNDKSFASKSHELNKNSNI